MTARIVDYLRTQHLGLIALVLVVAGGTAYAAGLAKDSVKSKQIKNGQVKSVDVKDQNLTGTDIADGSIGSPEVADGSIGSVDLLDSGIASADIANDAVIGQKIATGVVNGGKITPGAISNNKLEDGAVDTAKVADGSLTQADFDPTSVADVITKSSSSLGDGGLRSALTLPGFGELQFGCSALPNVVVNYVFESGVAQTATLVVRPSSGNADVDRVSVSPANAVAPTSFGDGYLWTDTGSRVARVEFTVQNVSGNCPYTVQATIDRDEA